jgi:serine protease AprX
LKTKLLLLFLTISQITLSQNFKRSSLVVSEDLQRALKEKSEILSKEYHENYKIASKKFSKTIKLINGKTAILQGMDEFGEPIYSMLSNYGATVTARANQLFEGGSLGLNLTGLGMAVGVWEFDHIRHTHEALIGRINNLENGEFSTSNEFTSHSTHVSGTIIGDGINNGQARGFAINATVNGYNRVDDLSEMADEAANGLLVSNHSYGASPINSSTGEVNWESYGYGKYSSRSRQIDNILNLSEYYLPVWAAGNDRNDAPRTYDLLYGVTNSKNSLTVAAVLGVSNYTGPESVSTTSFSNYGPTDDGRIKPDIATKGQAVFSTESTGDSDYASKSGTSMAAPGITGVVLLLQEHNYNINSSYLKSASVKGLLAHTADECDTNFFGADGPDYKYGWGLVNAERAATCIMNNGVTSLIYEGTLNEGESYELNLEALEGEKLIATISWSDPMGEVYNSSVENMRDYREPVLVNDLDLRVSNSTLTYFPWKLNPETPTVPATKGDNIVDNIEKVEVSDTSGTYNIVVNHKASLEGNSQNFSLIITGVNTSTFGVNDTSINSLRIWPNPAKETVNYQFASNSEQTCLVELIDLQGRIVYSQNIMGGAANIKGEINTSSYSKGVYFLNLSQGNQKSYKKVVLQ